MSDSKKDPRSLPPDDNSVTTPNIRIPGSELPSFRDEPVSDWEKTNYNYGKQINRDEWVTPATPPPPAAPPPDQPIDLNKTFIPGRQQPPVQSSAQPDWNLSDANIRMPDEQSPIRGEESFGSSRGDDYGKTTPYIQLPEAERRKYQQSAPPPAADQRKAAPVADPGPQASAGGKGGVPGWVYGVGAVLLMSFFAIAVLLGAYLLFLNKTGFNVTIRAKTGSEVFVDGVRWHVSSGDDSLKVQNLKAGQRRIVVRKQGFGDYTVDVTGKDGEEKEIIAQQSPTAAVQSDCDIPLRKGEFAKAEKCAYEALSKLTSPPNVDELLRAMNMYIINFASGSAAIPPGNLRFLEKASGYMKQLPQNVLIEVGGHTDNVGNDASNQRLSENRAKSVREALIKFGVQPEMLQMKGYGETKPRSSNDTEDGKFQNRRIEYVAVSK